LTVKNSRRACDADVDEIDFAEFLYGGYGHQSGFDDRRLSLGSVRVACMVKNYMNIGLCYKCSKTDFDETMMKLRTEKCWT
jgi:hypothetical protein